MFLPSHLPDYLPSPKPPMSQSLVPLVPSPLRPHGKRSLAVASIAFVHQIDALELHAACKANCFDDSDPKYRIDLFLRHQPNRIPSNQTKPSATRRSLKTPSDLDVLRSFGDFCELRECLLMSCKSSEYVFCDHCNRLNLFLLTSASQPNALIRLVTSDHLKWLVGARQLVLKSFLNKLLKMARDASSDSRSHSSCVAAEELPLVLDAFLHGGIVAHESS